MIVPFRDPRFAELDRLLAHQPKQVAKRPVPRLRRRYSTRNSIDWIARRRDYLIRNERWDLLQAEGLAVQP